MIDWTMVSQLVMCLVLLALVVGVIGLLTRPKDEILDYDDDYRPDDEYEFGGGHYDDGQGDDLDEVLCDDAFDGETQDHGHRVVPADEVREHMLTARQRASRSIAADVEAFKAHGDDATVIFRRLDGVGRDSEALIAELLDYQAAGWV